MSTEHTDISESQHKIRAIAELEGNKVCADCGATDPEWASINLGVFICIDCSGFHRSFGTHISKVRSVNLDVWEPEHIEVMRSIGNIEANKYWEHKIPPSMTRITPKVSMYVGCLRRLAWLA